MRPKNYIIALVFAAMAASACNKTDNYDGPTETLQGRIIDVGTGQNLQSEISGDGGKGTLIRLFETSWSANPTAITLATKQDGTYTNTKIFAATYKMSAEGAFVPMVQTGNDQSKTVEVKGGVTTVDFSVDPFLRIQWVGEPVINANKTVSVQVIVSRGTANTNFQQALEGLGVFVSPSPYVGNNNYDDRYSTRNTYSGTTGNPLLGTTVTLTTKAALPTGKEWFLRVGAYINQGLKTQNYTTIKSVTVN